MRGKAAERRKAFPDKLNEPAVELKPRLSNTVPAGKSLFGVNRVVPSNKSRSPASGAIPPQFAPVLQLLSPPPPFHTEVAPKASFAASALRVIIVVARQP